MRTTVRLSDELLARSKQEARKRGETLTSLLERGLRLAVSGSHKRARAARVAHIHLDDTLMVRIDVGHPVILR